MKRLSILGDSISTYIGISNNDAANESTGVNPYFYRPPFPLSGTYWARVIEHFGLSLCVNNAYSGGNLSGQGDPISGVSRAAALARDDGQMPDLILVFMGINDLGRGVDIGVFSADYRKTLAIIRQHYPQAKVVCVNLPDRHPSVHERTLLFNQAISDAVAAMGEGFYIADLFNSRLKDDFYYLNTLDGLHPDEDGMRIIADVVIDTIKGIEE